ncbi:unnamed protein product, partial [Brachionus calyciflorus]
FFKLRMDSQFSPFTIPQSPALPGSLLMPPPSLPPPSLPPPLTNERPNETPPHSSGDKDKNVDSKLGLLGSVQPQSLQPSLSFPGSINLGSYNPFSAQAPSTPLASVPSTVESHLQPTLQNIVSTVNLGCPLELKKIALYARNAEYNPKRFAAVIMRIRSPRTTALIFSSGKMVCTGAKSEEDSRLAARKYARIIQKLGFDAKFMDFKIQNIVGSIDVGFCLRLECFHTCHSQFSSYEPELFPGLIYRLHEPKVVLLIFVSGKVVITGAKLRTEINEAFEKIYPILKNFKKV